MIKEQSARELEAQTQTVFQLQCFTFLNNASPPPNIEARGGRPVSIR
jgi:hypothetical protein